MSFFKEIFGKGTMKGNIRLHNSMKIMPTIVSTIMIIINNFFNIFACSKETTEKQDSL
jgi:hypothetical protein